MISPKNNPRVGDRPGASERKAGKRGAGKRGTTREYNADELIYQPPERRVQFLRLEAERAGFGLVGDATLSVDHVKTIGPARVGLLGRVAEFIDHCGNLDA